MTKINSYEDLIAWQKAHAYVLDVYRTCKAFPKEELFALTSQLRRASTSVPSNIVEGFGRWSDAEKVRFYNIASASLKESHYQLRLAHDLGYADTIQLRELGEEVDKIINGLIRSTLPKGDKSST